VTTLCTLCVNGSARAAAIESDDTLLTVLRDVLGLKGAKRGCNQGVCGACTVLVGGRPMRSCLLLAANCENDEIITVEGLEHDNIGSRLQRAFAVSGAVQCGFCTPGMLISARAVLSRCPDPDVDQIRDGLSGNLCRCSGYRKIIDAVRLAASEVAA
jgi:aerobic carbon-monoxide dehydrogenase small subunit